MIIAFLILGVGAYCILIAAVASMLERSQVNNTLSEVDDELNGFSLRMIVSQESGPTVMTYYGRRIYDDEFGFAGGGGVLYPTEYAAIEQERFAEHEPRNETTELPNREGRAMEGVSSAEELVTDADKFVEVNHVRD